MEWLALVFHQIGNNKGDTSRNSGHAMHKHVGPLPLFMDELVGLLKVIADVEGLMIDGWDVQILHMRWDYFVQVFASYGSDDSPNAQSFISGYVLCRVSGFQAASMLLTQIPPHPLMGSTMHWMSSGNFYGRLMLDQNDNIIILLMENLPPINDMYACIQQQRDYDVIRKYEGHRICNQLGKKTTPTKKGSFLDDAIKMSSSPGPANKSNMQLAWVQPNKQLVKYSDRKTYIDQIQLVSKKRNSPSPNSYDLKMTWPSKGRKLENVSQKINFLDHTQYQSNQTPGPGSYLVATHIAKKVKQYHHVQNKPLKPRKDIAADMNTYDPVPLEYNTFKRLEKIEKTKVNMKKQQVKQNKKQRENLSPGPGQYQMINAWEGKYKKNPKGSLSYLNKITKGPSLNIYYN